MQFLKILVLVNFLTTSGNTLTIPTGKDAERKLRGDLGSERSDFFLSLSFAKGRRNIPCFGVGCVCAVGGPRLLTCCQVHYSEKNICA